MQLARKIFQSATTPLVTLALAALASSARPVSAAEAPRPGSLANVALWVDGGSAAAKQADAWKRSRPAEAALLAYIAAQPQAIWLGDWTRDVKGEVARTVAAARGRVPVFVAYNIPGRDCGQWSKGGADAGSYRAWIRDLAAGIGNGNAIVILEPDALAQMDCLSAEAREARTELLRDAVKTLSARPGVSLYVDAGHARWKQPAEIAERLRAIGVTGDVGFALNVSNYVADAENVAYGEKLSRALGGSHFVIDSSRNGLGSAGSNEWCNPAGRALGRAPTTETGNELVDAYLWVKRPGESDGECNGGPRAGQFWPEYAVGLAQRAAVGQT
jgi:endoglucanase